jgi:hypothetical protein
MAKEMAGYARQLPFPRSYRELRNLGQWIGVGLPENFADFLDRPLAEKFRFFALLGREIRSAMRVSRLNVAAVAGYRPQPHSGRTEFFQVLPDSPRSMAVLAALKASTRGKLRIHTARGNHMTVMLERGNAAVLADLIQMALAVAPDPPEQSSPELGGAVSNPIDAGQEELVAIMDGER